MVEEEDWKKRYEELRAKVVAILDNLDNIGFQIQGGAKQAKAEILGVVQPQPVQPQPNRAARRREERRPA